MTHPSNTKASLCTISFNAINPNELSSTVVILKLSINPTFAAKTNSILKYMPTVSVI